MTSLLYLGVFPGGDEADFQLDLGLMLLIDLREDQKFSELVFIIYDTKQNDSTSFRFVLTSKT